MRLKFEIRKNGDWNIKPCEEAIKETVTITNNIDVRSIDSPYKIWDTEEEVQDNWFKIADTLTAKAVGFYYPIFS